MKRFAIYTTMLAATAAAPALGQSNQNHQGQDRNQQQNHQYDQQQSQNRSRQNQNWNWQSQNGNRQSQNGNRQSRDSRQGRQQQQARKQRFEGELLAARTVKIGGSQDEHVLAKIRTDDGKVLIADLGPVSNLRRQNTQLRQGQRMDAEGTAGRINDKPVLVVDRFLGDGVMTTVTFQEDRQQRQGQRQRQAQRQRQRQGHGRQGQMQQRYGYRGDQQRMQGGQARQQMSRSGQRKRQGGQQPFKRQQVIQGRISGQTDVSLRNVSDEHRLVRIETRNGRTVVADLGTGQGFNDVNLNQGDEVIVVGNAARLNGRPVIFARKVAEVVDLKREQQADRATPNRGANQGNRR